ncbi:RNA polymerase sigma factor [Clostridium sp. WLY-B-L2]|uniref:RNA polymerase sigma factor n=1 Tax=Clostridium aromativorans TaxID=2836848 RepID=A0ABS8N8L9_9CLOT|nr:RNA polymerase sigma factor [Clostridium aromativorans]MCC9296155.1 RNA polymerase sigma factor [Clostridium aromativorans]
MADFGEIYAENFSGVYKYVLALCRNEDIAEEVTQETFFKAMQHIDKFNGSCKLYVWLCQIAKNTYFSLSKKRKRMALEIDGDFPYTTWDLERDYLDKDAARQLHVLIHNLNEPYKEVFTLRVFGELPFMQIGELFRKTDSWARLIFYRSKKQLQEAMR